MPFLERIALVEHPYADPPFSSFTLYSVPRVAPDGRQLRTPEDAWAEAEGELPTLLVGMNPRPGFDVRVPHAAHVVHCRLREFDSAMLLDPQRATNPGVSQPLFPPAHGGFSAAWRPVRCLTALGGERAAALCIG